MKFGSRNKTHLRLSQNTRFSLAAILKMARNTTFAMEISPETSFMFKSIINTITKAAKANMNGLIIYGFITFSTFIHFDGGHLGFTNFQVVSQVRFWQTIFFITAGVSKSWNQVRNLFRQFCWTSMKFAPLITGLVLWWLFWVRGRLI